MSIYRERESVLCYHGPMLYEAKIIAIKKAEDGHNLYTVHYTGWKEKFDETVLEDSIMKLDEDGLALQEELKAKFLKQGQDDDDVSPEDKDKRASGQFKVGKFYVANELTSILGKDWDIINRNHHLFVLPASITANDLLEEFQKVYRKKKIVGLGVFDQFTSGFKNALDAYIGRGLLYRFERLQLAQIIEAHPDKPLSEVYPPVLILRYLLKLPHQLDEINLGKGSQLFATTKKLVDALMKFIVDYRRDFFPATLYAPADPEYLKAVQDM